MTVNTTNITSGPYSGDDATTSFAYTFRVNSAAELLVYLTDAEGSTDPLTEGTHYTLTGLGDDAGGSVVMVTAPATGETLYIRANYPNTQLTEFTSQGGFFPAVHEDAIDKLTFQVQQLQDQVNRAARLPVFAGDAVDMTLPNPVVGNVIGWNATGDGLENADISGGNVTFSTNLAENVSFSASEASATATDVRTKLREKSTAGDYPIAADGLTDDSAAIDAAITGASRAVFFPAATYRMDDEAVVVGYGAVDGDGAATVFDLVTEDKKFVSFTDDGTAVVESPRVTSVTITQVGSSALGGGTANNHAPIAFTGSYNGAAVLNWLNNTALGTKWEYGSMTLSDRTSRNGLCAFNTYNGVEKMAIENIGASYTRVIGNSVEGARGTGVRGESHGLRLTGLTPTAHGHDARCKGVVASGNTLAGMLTGVSAQHSAQFWNVGATHLHDIQVGLQTVIPASADAVVSHGRTDFTFQALNQVANIDGGEYLDLHVNGSQVDYDASLADSGNAVIEANAPAFGGAGHNRYTGIIRDVDENGIDVRYPHAVFDVSLVDVNTAGTGGAFGARLVAGADGCMGRILVSNCVNGVTIFSDGNNLDLHVSNASADAIAVAGDNNLLRVWTDGTLTVTGTGNVVSGYADTVLDTSVDPMSNNYAGMTGMSATRTEFSAAVGGTGEVTVAHGLKTDKLTVVASMYGSVSDRIGVKSVTSTNVVFEIRSATGALITSGTRSFMWRAQARDA